MSSELDKLPPTLRANPAARGIAAKLEAARRSNGKLRAAIGDSASISSGALCAGGGALVGAAETGLPSLVGMTVAGVPWPLIAGIVGVVVGAGAGSAVAVDVAGGMAACGARDFIRSFGAPKP